MNAGRLVRRSLWFYWRTNVAVVLGVATAVSVLAGALLVGHSIRTSLADLVEARLGRTDLVIASPLFFRERLAADLASHPQFAAGFTLAVPLIVADAVVTAQESGRRAGRVAVYGVDDRFWQFHGVAPVSTGDREVALSPALARELDARQGTVVLVRVQRPSDIPLETLHSRKDDLGRTLRLTTHTVLDASSLGEFSLRPQQGDVLAAFVSIDRLRSELEVGDRVNTILVSRRADVPGATLDPLVDAVVEPEDVALTVRASDADRDVIVESPAGFIADPLATVIEHAAPGAARLPIFTYLANTMRVGEKTIPYSLVTGIDSHFDLGTGGWPEPMSEPPAIVLNTWAARELNAKGGERLAMEYYLWEEPGQLVTRRAEFQVAGIVPIEAGSRDLAPPYPGISNSTSVSDWDPPFPLDLRRVRPVDEEYWTHYRTTPKAFLPIEVARKLWGSRYGALTSVRITPPSGQRAAAFVAPVRASLKAALRPRALGIAARDVRVEGLTASRGATDFGEYFVYFSFFLVVSALVLVVLFFKLGIEQRVKEVGLLRAVGLSPSAIRRLFTIEGAILAVVGSALGIGGAVAYARALIWALTTRWIGAVGTTALSLHVSVVSLAIGAVSGVVAAIVCIWWTLGRLQQISERALLAGDTAVVSDDGGRATRARWFAPLLALAGVSLAALSAAGRVPAAAGFFGAGALLLIAALVALSAALRRPGRWTIAGGWWPLTRLAARGAAQRPSRTVLSVAVIACATFVLVTVDAFRRDGSANLGDRQNGTGGYQLMVTTLLPIVEDPNAAAGRDALNLFDLDAAVRIEPFRVRPGDDASCLNLYQPQNPRIVAPRDAFLAERRFAFQASAAANDDELANPWLLLRRKLPDGAIPVITDANSMTYVLHRAVGDDLTITSGVGPVTLRFVASLRDSIFQSELLMSEDNFRLLFPGQQGFQLMLVEGAAAEGGGRLQPDQLATKIEQSMSDFGADAVVTSDYLASFHRVENTYLSTFQTLGGLGLLLGTVGLATVLLRNLLERRRELALLAAVGYRRSHVLAMTVIENALIVIAGLVIGTLSAAVAIAPAVGERGGGFPLSSSVILLLFSVFAVAILSSFAALAAASNMPLLQALRSE